MRNPANYGDTRQTAWCCHCSGAPETSDHVPSKILLDEPYPTNLPTVGVCYECNNGLSADEQYLACLIECVLRGSTDLELIVRPKVREALEHSPALRAAIDAARQTDESGTRFMPDWTRVNKVVLKLLRGHALYELNEPHHEDPMSFSIKPKSLMTLDERTAFEAYPTDSPFQPWPEIGSRAMMRMVVGSFDSGPWLVVQEGRYRYMAVSGQGITVRAVLSEYLYAEALWD